MRIHLKINLVLAVLMFSLLGAVIGCKGDVKYTAQSSFGAAADANAKSTKAAKSAQVSIERAKSVAAPVVMPLLNSAGENVSTVIAENEVGRLATAQAEAGYKHDIANRDARDAAFRLEMESTNAIVAKQAKVLNSWPHRLTSFLVFWSKVVFFAYIALVILQGVLATSTNPVAVVFLKVVVPIIPAMIGKWARWLIVKVWSLF